MMDQGYSGYLHYNVDPVGRTRFYGVYRGTVMDSTDPEGKNRLSVRVPQVSGSDILDFAEACLPPILGSEILIPEVGSDVWVMFESGDPSYPIWIGVK